jgi:hypothetical protein
VITTLKRVKYFRKAIIFFGRKKRILSLFRQYSKYHAHISKLLRKYLLPCQKSAITPAAFCGIPLGKRYCQIAQDCMFLSYSWFAFAPFVVLFYQHRVPKKSQGALAQKEKVGGT